VLRSCAMAGILQPQLPRGSRPESRSAWDMLSVGFEPHDPSAAARGVRKIHR